MDNTYVDQRNFDPAISNPAASNDDDFGTWSTLFDPQQESSQIMETLLSQEVNNAAADTDLFFSTMGANSSDQLDSNHVSSSSSDISAASLISAPTSEVSGSMESSSNNQSQLQIINELLRERRRQSDAINADLRRAMDRTLDDLNHADTVVEDLLSAGGLSAFMFDQLKSVYSKLKSAKEKLK
ncbi:hypothetical protein E8E14_006863 [Neopestalotiopsis sp. 37M]|nr:hypothetical protein E8E14_006863 [Neopestalotiopsis sp. 37M]